MLQVRERLQLAIAADQWGEPALLRNLQPRAAAELADDSVGPNGLCLPFDLEVTQILEDEESMPEVLSAPAHDNLTRLGEHQEPGRQVYRVPHRRLVHPQILADGADHDEARVDAHSHSELDAVHPSHVVGQGFELPLDRERGADRAM